MDVVQQGGCFDVRLIASSASVGNISTTPADYIGLIASTPTIGAVRQADGWDVRLIASTASIGSITVTPAENIRLVASTPTIGNVGQGGAFDVRLIASTPTLGGVNATQAGSWDVRSIATTATQPVTASGDWNMRLIASTPTIGAVTQGGGFDVRLIAGSATVATVTAVNPVYLPVYVSGNLLTAGTTQADILVYTVTSGKNLYVTNLYISAQLSTPTTVSFTLGTATWQSPLGAISFQEEWVNTTNYQADIVNLTFPFPMVLSSTKVTKVVAVPASTRNTKWWAWLGGYEL